MSYEPRSRGIRSRRTTTKKTPSKESKESEAYTFVYKENVPVNPKEVSSRAMNELEHLGNQRFGMPPFAEHFQRWLLDVDSVLNDFRSSLPKIADADFEATVGAIIADIRSQLTMRIDEEKTHANHIAEIQHQLLSVEAEIGRLESEQKGRINYERRSSETSMKKIGSEIDALESQRLKILRAKPTLLERIMGSAKVKIEGNARSLESKRSALQRREVTLKRRLDTLKSDHDEKRKPLVARSAELREELTKLQRTTLEDAVEIRRVACEKLRQTIAASAQPLPEPKPANT
jgi:hypothetical protein